jgi:hypothetical protein
MIEEDERADHATARIGQNPPDLEPAEVTPSLINQELDHRRFSGFSGLWLAISLQYTSFGEGR